MGHKGRMPQKIEKLLVVALKPEWSFLKQHYRFTSDSKHKELFFINDKNDTALLQIGLGRKKAGSVFLNFLADFDCHQVLHFGSSGALIPSLNPGDLFLAGSIRHQTQIITVDPTNIKTVTDRFPSIQTGSLLTVDAPLVKPHDKRDAHLKYSADTVDMESFAIANICAQKNVGYLSLRSVFDKREEDIESLGLPCDENGNFQPARFVGNLVTHPKLVVKIPSLQKRHHRMNQNFKEVLLWFLEKM